MNKNTWLIYILITKLHLLLEIQSLKTYPSEYFLKPLLETQRNLIDGLQNVIHEKRKLVHFMEKERKRYIKEHRKAKRGNESDIGNAIKRFAVLNRLTFDLNDMGIVMERKIKYNRNDSLTYVDDEDLEASVQGISRLQRCYHLNVAQLAEGILNTTFSQSGEVYTEHFLPMMASDCFRIAEKLYQLKAYSRGVLWFIESLRLYEKSGLVPKVKLAILEAICEGYHKADNNVKYLDWAEKLLAYKPNHPNKVDYEAMIDINKLRNGRKLYKRSIQKKQSKYLINLPLEARKCTGFGERGLHRKHCRNELNVPHEISKKLKCWYFREYHPFLRLAPIKAEQLYIRPDIFLYHDVISDREIEQLKEIAIPKLKPSKINKDHHSATDVVMKTMYIRQCTPMTIIENQPQRLNERINDFTGLLAENTFFVVNNYGPAGHFYTHLDAQRLDIFSEEKIWSTVAVPELPSKSDSRLLKSLTYQTLVLYVTARGAVQFMSAIVSKRYVKDLYNISIQNMKRIEELAKTHLPAVETVLFYLSDVEQGGATVFPVLGLTVFPKKGASLVFTNTIPYVQGDVLCHAACPVLRGSKWVLTKWINHHYQTMALKRPCVEEFISRPVKEMPVPIIKKYLNYFCAFI